MKRTHNLKRTGFHNPVLAALGVKNIMDNAPLDYGTVVKKKEQVPKAKTEGMGKSRIRRYFKKSEE